MIEYPFVYIYIFSHLSEESEFSNVDGTNDRVNKEITQSSGP
jgi:hypothetical protein